MATIKISHKNKMPTPFNIQPLLGITFYTLIIIAALAIIYVVIDLQLEYSGANTYARNEVINRATQLRDLTGNALRETRKALADQGSGFKKAFDEAKIKVFNGTPAVAKNIQLCLRAIIIVLVHLIAFCMLFKLSASKTRGVVPFI